MNTSRRSCSRDFDTRKPYMALFNSKEIADLQAQVSTLQGELATAQTAHAAALADIQANLEAAQAIAAEGIDILVNLNGYYGFGRSDVFAQRPAPVDRRQVGGTTGGTHGNPGYGSG